MRVIYPDDINDEMRQLSPYMEYNSTQGWHLQETAPKDIVERYKRLIIKIDEINNGD